MTEEHMKFSRRDFLKASAVVGAGLAAGGAMAGCAAAPAEQAIEWDREADVVVAGSGTAVFAALAAKDAGAESVLIIEKSVAWGGTSALSGGGFWLPMNYRMAEAGIEDNRADAIQYLTTVSEGRSDDALIAAYIDNAPRLAEWMRDTFGYRWFLGEEALGNRSYMDYYEVPGFRAYGRTIYLVMGEEWGMGAGAWSGLRATAEGLGIEILLETPATALVTNDDGEVIGVLAEGADGPITIKANKGVVLGTGGFDFNPAMRDAYLRGPIVASESVPTNTGDGHLMGMALDADLRNMPNVFGLTFFPPGWENLRGIQDPTMYRGKPGTIVVNKHGERIGNEASAYHLFNRAFYVWDSGLFEWRNIPSYWIADSTFAQSWFFPGSNYEQGVVPDWMESADTLEGLCEILGVDFDGLQATLDVFNPNAAEGRDPVWHRGEYQFDLNTAGNPFLTELPNPCLAPIANPPFYGCEYGPGSFGTNGGLRINENGQVLSVRGLPIPRLYAVGNTCGSVMGAAYPGGGSCLGGGSVFGMLAGRHAAGLESI